METGSLMNLLRANATPKTPEVGMGATILLWTDRYACTVTKVEPKRVTVREDVATRTDANGMSDAQSYAYHADPNGREWVFTLRKSGRWVCAGDPPNGTALHIGVRNAYHDYSF